MSSVRNARSEASEVLGSGRIAAVLEPSPPAVNEGPWFADHPVAVEDVDDAIVVSPLDDAWTAAAREDPAVARYARDHWLGDLKRLEAVPLTFDATRRALTALAFYVVAPARQVANGKIGLRWTKGGFGTPFFGNDRQVRVEGSRLVVQDGDTVDSVPITTLRAAASFVGVTPAAPVGINFHDAPAEIDADTDLEVDAGAIALLDDWFGFSTLVLERLHARAGSPTDTRVQLWPEHFDAAIELGDADGGTRASYGASPGDATIPVPYLYVSPWAPQQGEFWGAPFGGAALTIDELSDAPDQVAAALKFLESARSLLG